MAKLIHLSQIKDGLKLNQDVEALQSAIAALSEAPVEAPETKEQIEALQAQLQELVEAKAQLEAQVALSATKTYVDAVSQGLSVKAPVRVATSEQQALTEVSIVDGVDLVEGDRVLLLAQDNKAENGIYVLEAGALVRAEDADNVGGKELASGAFAFVQEGSLASAGFVLSTAGEIEVGTTELEFVQFSGAGEVLAGAGLVKEGNTISLDSEVVSKDELLAQVEALNASIAEAKKSVEGEATARQADKVELQGNIDAVVELVGENQKAIDEVKQAVASVQPKAKAEDVFNAEGGELEFALSQVPGEEKVSLLINGVHYREGSDFTVDREAKTATWTSTAANGGFDIFAEAEIVFSYTVA